MRTTCLTLGWPVAYHISTDWHNLRSGLVIYCEHAGNSSVVNTVHYFIQMVKTLYRVFYRSDLRRFVEHRLYATLRRSR